MTPGDAIGQGARDREAYLHRRACVTIRPLFQALDAFAPGAGSSGTPSGSRGGHLAGFSGALFAESVPRYVVPTSAS